MTDNAASSLGKVLEFHPNVGDATLADTWLRTLPLTHDTVEARIVHDQLLRFVEKSDARCATPIACLLCCPLPLPPKTLSLSVSLRVCVGLSVPLTLPGCVLALFSSIHSSIKAPEYFMKLFKFRNLRWKEQSGMSGM